MKTNFLKLFTYFLLHFSFLSLLGQNDEQNKDFDSALYINPTQLVFPEILLTYEYFPKDNLSLSLSGGYKIPIKSEGELNSFGSGLFAVYEKQYMFNKYANGVYISVAPSWYSKSDKKFFFSPELFYRNYWFNDKIISYENIEGGSYNSTRSENNYVIGLKLLLGFIKKMKLNEKRFAVFKFYYGCSTRYKVYKYENIDNILSDGTIDSYSLEEGNHFVPFTIQLGFKVGISNLISNTK